MAEEKTVEFERAIGRRKCASARVRLHSAGTGKITINDRELDSYFPLTVCKDMVTAPLRSTGKEKQFDISIRVMGGGIMSQAQAVRHGIARALVKWNADLKAVLKAEGFMTRDARVKERKKFGRRKARRGRQWRKR